MAQRNGPDCEPDGAMVAAFLAGKRSGLQAVYSAYGNALYSVARNALGDADDAQDCVHDTLLRVWQRVGQYRADRGSLRAYLLVCVRNDALTRRRNAARHHDIEVRAARAETQNDESDMIDPVDGQRLRRALAALPAEQKVALELAYFDGLTHVEVAARLHVPLARSKAASQWRYVSFMRRSPRNRSTRRERIS